MADSNLKEELEKAGFVSHPDLPGNPDFGHFGAKLALCVRSRVSMEDLEPDERVKFNLDFRRRFAALRQKKWQCQAIYEEDPLEKTIEEITKIMLMQEASRIHLPSGPEPTREKLIKLLQQTDEALISEVKKRKRNHFLMWGLEKRRKHIERYLHVVVKPFILSRDNNRCLACGSVENLQLARLSGGDMALPEKLSKKRTLWRYPSAEQRWAEQNMLTLCEKCHKLFDSFNARRWRRKLGPISIQQAIEMLQSGKLKEMPPISPEARMRIRQLLACHSTKTFFKVLRKAVISAQQGNSKRARLFLGLVKRQWGFISKDAFFPKDVETRTEVLLQEMYMLGSIEERWRGQNKPSAITYGDT